MFRFEKDMIPILKNGLSEKYKTKYFIEEFSTGIGVADLVFTLDITNRCSTLNDYESIYYVEQYFHQVNKKINVNKLIDEHSLNKDKMHSVIEYMRNHNYIVESVEGDIQVNNRYMPAIDELYSIEAKIKDWKSGFYQALRYKNFSHKTFLAISEKFIHRVDLNQLKDYHVGLISVNESTIDILYNPPKEKPKNRTSFYYNAEVFYSYYKNEFMMSY